MTDVRVRDLDDDIVSLLKEQARGNQRTLENYIREVLTELATRPRRELALPTTRHRRARCDSRGERIRNQANDAAR